MRNGLQKISFFTFLYFLVFSIDAVLAEDIQLGPLINLDQIEPSYDSFDDAIMEYNPNSDISKNDLFIGEKDVNYASLSILNKITANVDDLEIKLKENFSYGELRIYPIECYFNSPEDKPEIAVYLNIYHKTKDKKIFAGWMLKTLPSISAIEHPIYDIWVNDCH